MSWKDEEYAGEGRQPALEFCSVCAGYGRKQVLQGVSFPLVPHKMTAVIGKNGSGKSTLLSCVNRQLRYTGRITCGGIDLAGMPDRGRAREVAILPQFLPPVPLTVEQLASMGRNPYLDLGRRLTEADWQQIGRAIELVGLLGKRGEPVSHLSGGERQKAYLAMVLAQDTPIIMLDEPAAHLDMEYEAELMRLLCSLKEKGGKTLLVVLHDLTRAAMSADYIALLHGGEVAFYGSAQACVESGKIEEVFHVKRCEYEENGRKQVLYHG